MNKHGTGGLPNGWTVTTLGDVSDVVGGGTPNTRDASNYEGGGIPWITPADLSGYKAKYISSGARFITVKGLNSSGTRMLPAGTVLFSSRAPIGYVTIAANPVCTNQGFKSFVLREGVNPEYVFYYLKYAKEIATGLASGTTFLEISGAKAATIPIPIAPTNEQHRIVEEIDKQFSRLDVAVAALKRVKTNLKRYRSAVLCAACEGRLVPTAGELARQEGRDYEPADVLLQRILAERRARWEAEQLAKLEAQGRLPLNDTWKAKYQEPAAPDASDLPVLPKGWCWAAIGLVAPLLAGYAFSSAAFKHCGVKLLKGVNVRDGWIAEEEIDFWDEEDAKRFNKYILTVGDVVIAMDRPVYSSGSCATKVAQLNSKWNRCLLLQRVGKFQAASCLASSYLFTFVRSEFFRQYLIKHQNGSQDGKDLPHISARTVDATPFPLPPFAEQERIVAEVEKRLSIVEEVEATVRADLKRAERLRQSILQCAFSGKLIPQDPNDERASVLLERIRAERANIIAPTRVPRLNKRLVDSDPQPELPL